MRRCCLWIVVAALGLCVGCAGLGYFLALPRFQSAAADQMAESVATSVAGRLAGSAGAAGTLVLREADIDVNNDDADGCGINVDNAGTRIYGVVTEIRETGITLRCSGNQDLSYSAVPVVEDGRVELTEVTTSSNWMRFLLPKEKFADGLEEGINQALDARGLRPVSIELRDGSMAIRTESAAAR
jgi:hypothetical protein